MALAGRLRRFAWLYDLGRRIHLRYTHSGRLLVFVIVVSAIIGIDMNRSFSYQIFTIVFCLLFIAWLVTLRRGQSLEVQRLAPELASVGQTLRYRLRIHNDGDEACKAVRIQDTLKEVFPSAEEFQAWRRQDSRRENWFDRRIGYPGWLRQLAFNRGGDLPSAHLDEIGPGETREFVVEFVPGRRGYLNFEGVFVGHSEPLGLCRYVQRQSLPGRLLVMPKIYPLPRVVLAGGRHYHQGGVSLAASTADAAEFHGLRDYRAGDPIRNIHWRSFAKLGEPVIKTWEEEYFVRHALVLDTYGEERGSRLFEEAVSTAASMALACNDQELLLELMFVAGQAHSFTAGRHVDSLHGMLEVLACVQPEPATDISILTQNVLARGHQLASVMCVFLSWDQSRRDLLDGLRKCGISVTALVVTDGHGEKAVQGEDGQFLLSMDHLATQLVQVAARITEGGP